MTNLTTFKCLGTMVVLSSTLTHWWLIPFSIFLINDRASFSWHSNWVLFYGKVFATKEIFSSPECTSSSEKCLFCLKKCQDLYIYIYICMSFAEFIYSLFWNNKLLFESKSWETINCLLTWFILLQVSPSLSATLYDENRSTAGIWC